MTWPIDWIRESKSAVTFASPAICLMSDVNWPTKSNCLGAAFSIFLKMQMSEACGRWRCDNCGLQACNENDVHLETLLLTRDRMCYIFVVHRLVSSNKNLMAAIRYRWFDEVLHPQLCLMHLRVTQVRPLLMDVLIKLRRQVEFYIFRMPFRSRLSMITVFGRFSCCPQSLIVISIDALSRAVRISGRS